MASHPRLHDDEFAALVAALPGGHLIGDRWAYDRWVVVGVDIDRRHSHTLETVVAAFAADPAADRVWLWAPRIAADLLTWLPQETAAGTPQWSTYPVGDDLPWTGATLTARLAALTAASDRVGRFELDEIVALAADIADAADIHRVDADDVHRTVCVLLAAGAPLTGVVDCAAAVCADPTR